MLLCESMELKSFPSSSSGDKNATFLPLPEASLSLMGKRVISALALGTFGGDFSGLAGGEVTYDTEILPCGGLTIPSSCSTSSLSPPKVM